MAWQSETNSHFQSLKSNRIVQFASFLIGLQEYTDTLEDLFEKKKGQLLEWTKMQPKELEAATAPVDAAEDE